MLRMLPLLFLLPIASLSAQTVDVFARAIDATKEGRTHVHGGVATVDLTDAAGFEAGVDLFWTPRISTEFSVASVRHELEASAFGEHADLGPTHVTPFTAVLELHTNPQGKFDVHLGAGGAYVTFDEVADTAELTLLGVRSIEFHDKLVPAADAGACFRLGPRWAVTADAKWLDIRTDVTATYLDGTSEGASLNLSQLTLGAGLSFRF